MDFKQETLWMASFRWSGSLDSFQERKLNISGGVYLFLYNPSLEISFLGC